MRPDQLPLLRKPSSPSVHPGGSWAVAALTRPDFAADAEVGQLWRIPFDGTAPRRITRGFRDTAPRFSPDGALIGFLRATPAGPAQLAIVPAEGGEPIVVTATPLGVGDFDFTPDSRSIVFVSRVPEQGRYGTLEGVDPVAEDARRITTLQFQMNAVGYLGDKRAHLFVVDVPDPWGEPPVRPVGRAAKGAPKGPDGSFLGLVPPARQLTQGDFDHQHPVPIEGAVIAVSARHSGRDSDVVTDLYRFDLEGGEPERLTNTGGDHRLTVAWPVIGGDHLYFVGADRGTTGRDFIGALDGVFVMPLAGGPARRLTDAASIDISAPLATDGDAVLAIDNVRGSGAVLRLTAEGDLARLPVSGSAVAVAAGGGRSLALVATPSSPGELVLMGDEARQLTDFAADLRTQTTVIEPIELLASAPDGAAVHGWVLVPPTPGPHPVLVTIHGGPFASFGPSYFDEAQVYAAAGYAVVMCNPRGSAGYGRAHGLAVKGAFGDRDAVDVLAFLDHAVASVPGLAPDRVGIMGGSYGGYLAAWIIAHHHRFAGAIVERGFLDPRSFVGASDIGWYFPHEYNTDDPAVMDAQSPLLRAGQVRTPTLVIHAEQDLRCPLSQALRYYTELKLAGVESELLIFPGENHEMSRSGRPHHRRERFEAILDWWDRHLPVAR